MNNKGIQQIVLDAELAEALLKNAHYKSSGGRHRFTCRKGLWGVEAESFEEALRESLTYLTQYMADGEYDDTKTATKEQAHDAHQSG